MSVPALRRAAYRTVLRGFRALPAPMRRTIVRSGTPSFTVGAVAVIECDGEVLFLRQPHRPGWSLPGGLLDRGEEAAEAVVREVREETGLQITAGLPTTCLVNGRVRRVDVIYVLPVPSKPEIRPGGEAETYTWMRVEEVDVADDSTREILQAVITAREQSAGDA